MANPFLNWRERSRVLNRDDLPESSPGRSKQMLDVLSALLCLDLLLAFHGVRSGLKSLLMNQLPRYLGSSIHTSALILALQSVLQIGGMTDVITAISFALKYIDKICHIVSLCRITLEHS